MQARSGSGGPCRGGVWWGIGMPNALIRPSGLHILCLYTVTKPLFEALNQKRGLIRANTQTLVFVSFSHSSSFTTQPNIRVRGTKILGGGTSEGRASGGLEATTLSGAAVTAQETIHAPSGRLLGGFVSLALYLPLTVLFCQHPCRALLLIFKAETTLSKSSISTSSQGMWFWE